MLLSNHLGKIKSRITKRQILIIASLFFITGVSILSISYYQMYKEEKARQKKITTFLKYQEEIPNPEFIENNTETQQVIKQTEKYIAVLEIPSINLRIGLYDKNSKLNDVNKNVKVLNESVMPDVDNGNFILAGHSGHSKIAYFNNLKKLSKNDVAYVYYNSEKISYKLVSQYEIDKTGKAKIIRNFNKKTLTLITCKQHSDKQVIYIFEGDEYET